VRAGSELPFEFGALPKVIPVMETGAGNKDEVIEELRRKVRKMWLKKFRANVVSGEVVEARLKVEEGIEDGAELGNRKAERSRHDRQEKRPYYALYDDERVEAYVKGVHYGGSTRYVITDAENYDERTHPNERRERYQSSAWYDSMGVATYNEMSQHY
jgi:hypothetical protein